MTNITVFYHSRCNTWVVIADGEKPGNPRFIMHSPLMERPLVAAKSGESKTLHHDGTPWTRDQALETAQRIYGTEATIVVQEGEQKALFD